MARRHPPTIRTALNRERFLTIIAQGGSVRSACQALSISRDAIYQWRDNDEDFRKAWENSYEDGTDLYEDALRGLAAQGNLGAIIFALKCRRPHVYHRKAPDTEDLPAITDTADNGEQVRFYMPSNRRDEPDTEEDEGPIIEGEAEAA